ncbi:MAG: septum formation initiator family protein [Silanimonas sp.]
MAIVLLWQLERGDGGRAQLSELQARVAAQEAENAKLEQRNQALAADVAELKSGEAAVEDRARAELGMIKPGETFYRVVEGGTTPVAATSVPVGADASAAAADAGTVDTGTAATDEPRE